MKRFLVLATLVVIGLMLFALPRYASGTEQKAETLATEWQKTPGRQNQWFKELGEFPGDIRLMTERNRGNVLYILMKQCVRDKQFYSLAWYRGDTAARGYTCEGRHLYSTETALWVKRGGELPPKLLEELKKIKPK